MGKKILLIAVGVIGILVLAALVLPFVIDVDRFRPAIESKLDTALGRQVTIGRLDLSVWSGDLKAAVISISDDPAFSRSPFVRAKSLEVGIDLLPLILSRALHLRSITLREPEVVLLRSSSGKWNFSSLGQSGKKAPSAQPPQSSGPSGGPEFTMQKLKIADGRMSIGSSPRRQQTYDHLNLTAENVSYQSAFPFTLQARTPAGGEVQLEGSVGPIGATDTAQTPFQAKVTLKGVDLASSGFLDPASGIAGKVDYQGVVRSDGKVAHAEGAAKVAKLRLVKNGVPANQPVTFEYASDYDLAQQSGRLTKGQLLTGKSTLAITGTYETRGESPVVHMKLNAPNIPVQDIQALLPALGVTLPAGSSLQGGAVKTNLSLDGAIDRLVTTGDVNLSNARLSGFGLASKMAALSAFTGLKASQDTLIQVMSSNLRIAPEGMRFDNLNLVVPDLGTITGAGAIANNNALSFKMLANIAAGGALANLATRVGIGGAGGKGIPFLIQGTASSPVFVPDTGAMVRSGVENLMNPQGTSQPKGLGDILGGILGRKKQQ